MGLVVWAREGVGNARPGQNFAERTAVEEDMLR